MKRSTQVSAPLLAAAAFSLLTACRRQPEMQRCVDEQNHVVADNLCAAAEQQQPVRNPAGGFYPIMPYRYYYGGLGGYALGSLVSGGGYNAIPGRSYATNSRASSTTRGGFGSSHGGGSSEGGGGE